MKASRSVKDNCEYVCKQLLSLQPLSINNTVSLSILTLSRKRRVEKLGVCWVCSMCTNLAQKMASVAVYRQRGKMHSWRNRVIVRFLVTSGIQITWLSHDYTQRSCDSTYWRWTRSLSPVWCSSSQDDSCLLASVSPLEVSQSVPSCALVPSCAY